MSFQVHPGAGSGPQEVLGEAVSGPIPLADHTTLDPATGRTVMLIRVVQVDDGGAAAATPSLRLAGAAGSPVAVDTNTEISGVAGGSAIARATHTVESGHVHLVEIEVLEVQPRWQLQIGNSDGRTHHYVVVAGSTDVDTRQPWLDLPVGSLEFVARLGETAALQELPVANHGPGPLTLADADGTALGSGFTLLSVSPRPIGGNGRGTARIGFTTPAAPAELAVTHTFASNDPGAGTSTGHRNRVALAATVHPGPRWSAGDVLMLGELSLGRLDRTTGELVPVVADTAGAVDVSVDPTTGDAVLLGGGFVKRVNRFTGTQTALPDVATLTTPVGLGVDRDGTIVVLHRGADAVLRIKPDGTQDLVQLNGLGNPQDMALEPNGDVVLVYGFQHFSVQAKVARIDRFGSIITVTVGDALNSPSGGPLTIAVEPDGTVLVARGFQGGGGGFTFSAGVLIRVDPQSGTQQTYVEKNVLHDPAALAVAADGTILVAAGEGLFAVHPQSGQAGDPTRLSPVSGARIAVVPPLGTP
jgi:hypothetical protein